MNSTEYLERLAPQLHALKLATIVAATGLSKASCSMIRRGRSIPHARHWETLAELIGGIRSGEGALGVEDLLRVPK
jgi:hypothetical protein